jgi:hypothetical protein
MAIAVEAAFSERQTFMLFPPPPHYFLDAVRGARE